MTVVLTSPVEGKQPGDTYTGANEAYHLASGYARRDASPDPDGAGAGVAVAAYAGPGVANTGPADTTIANNREFDATRGPIATGSDLPQGGTNDGITTKAYPAPTTDAV